MTKPAIALVVPDLTIYSGVPALAVFLHRVILEAGRHTPHLISIATSSRDRNSLRLSSPGTWRGPRISTEETRGLAFKHVGAIATELEFMRYRPRRVLTNELRRYDLVQMIGGTPPWALVAGHYDGPIALQFATLTAMERESVLRETRGPRRLWLRGMSKITAALEPRALRLADAVFVINQMMHDRLAAEYGSVKIKFAPPGVDTEFYQPREYQPGRPIVSVGRFGDPRKNVSMLFRAYKLLREARPNAPKLVLAGETGPGDAELTLAGELGILPHLEIHQAVSLEELRELYRTASMFTLSSDEEGLAIVIIEAMACGIPVVSTRCGGPETTVVEGETGFLTPVGDAAALAKQMQVLLDDEALSRRFGANGRARAVEKFSLAATVRVFLDTYDELLAKYPRRRVQ